MLYRLIMTLLTYQTMMTGAKVKPTLLVPKRWNANSRMRIAQEMPTIAPARPSTENMGAASTDLAVQAPSAKE